MFVPTGLRRGAIRVFARTASIGKFCLFIFQRTVAQAVAFSVYIGGLLQRLYESGIGCYIGNVFVGALAYADDVVLLAPTHSAMRRMLTVCENFAKDFGVIFNPIKSMCMLVSKSWPKRARLGI